MFGISSLAQRDDASTGEDMYWGMEWTVAAIFLVTSWADRKAADHQN